MIPRRAPIEELWRGRPRSRLLRATLLLLSVLTVLAWASLDFTDLFSPRRRANLMRFLTEDAVPYPLRETGFSWSGFFDWALGVLAERGWSAALATLAISALAIVLAAAGATVLAPFAARNLVTARPFRVGDLPDEHAGRSFPWRLLTGAVRFVFVLLRAIPEYVWAFLLLAMLGPSAAPAVLALALHNAGILGRLGAETVENLDAAPLRSLRMLGASRRQLYPLAILPLAMPRLLLYFFYRFETCVREATVLGMLGVVSLGYWIQDARGRHFYDEMLLLVGLGAGIVLVGDLVSHFSRGFVRRAS